MSFLTACRTWQSALSACLWTHTWSGSGEVCVILSVSSGFLGHVVCSCYREGRSAFQGTLKMLEKWAARYFMKFNQDKCKVLHQRQTIPMHQFRLGRMGKEQLYNKKSQDREWELRVYQQCALGAKKTNSVLGCIYKSTADSQGNLFFPLYSRFVRSHLGNCIQVVRSPAQETHWHTAVSPREYWRTQYVRRGWGGWTYSALKRSSPKGEVTVVCSCLMVRHSKGGVRLCRAAQQ